ncbi:MAG: RimJ/RimL family protein N-acetyltransferase [Ulvibacter sp.]|jgi:RimJ/RimL family protein N-acetyltransferase|tara:strand:+ start:3391 stop:3993 length:603 start_codon:yes stop_codon:yes gene_type:complete
MHDLDFDKDYILENKEVRLRPLTIDDIISLSEFSINEPNLWKYSLTPADGLEHLENYINLALEGRRNSTSYPFIVYDKRTNRYAGCTRFYDFQKQHQTTQIGYTWYGENFQGTGLNKNCKFLLLEFAFEKLKLERVEFRADANNKRSIAAMQSIGCKKEGILRQNCNSPSGRRDSIVLSILKTEWIQDVKKQLSKKLSRN